METANTLVNFECFIIHLERARERSRQVGTLANSLPYKTEIVSAVDGKSETFDSATFYKRSMIKPTYPFVLRDAEVATFLSHRKCWQRIVDKDIDAGLIVEDDVGVTEPDFGNALSLALENIQQGDIVRFPIKLREKLDCEIAAQHDVKLFHPTHVGLGAQVQIVSRRAAEILLSKTEEFDRPVDTYLQLFWLHGVRTLSVWPNGVSEDSVNLGGSLIGAKQSLWTKLKHETRRPIYRIQVQHLARKQRL